MKVEADKVLIKPEVVTTRAITLVRPTIPMLPAPPKHVKIDIVYSKKVGVIYSDQDKECAAKVMDEVGGVRIESPHEIFNCKYVVWIASADSANDCHHLLDMATMFTDKLLIFWWRAVAIESIIDVTMMSTREIYESSYAFFPTSGTYICSNTTVNIHSGLHQLTQWIKGNKTPQGQKIKSQKFY